MTGMEQVLKSPGPGDIVVETRLKIAPRFWDHKNEKLPSQSPTSSASYRNIFMYTFMK